MGIFMRGKSVFPAGKSLTRVLLLPVCAGASLAQPPGLGGPVPATTQATVSPDTAPAQAATSQPNTAAAPADNHLTETDPTTPASCSAFPRYRISMGYEAI